MEETRSSSLLLPVRTPAHFYSTPTAALRTLGFDCGLYASGEKPKNPLPGTHVEAAEVVDNRIAGTLLSRASTSTRFPGTVDLTIERNEVRIDE